MYRAREECGVVSGVAKRRWRHTEASLAAYWSVAVGVAKFDSEGAEGCPLPWRSVTAVVPQYDYQSYRSVATFILRYEIWPTFGGVLLRKRNLTNLNKFDKYIL